MDFTNIHPSCLHQTHHVDLHLWRGAPKNLDEDHPVQIIVNQGYVVGFCPDRLQPSWAAYRVAHADDDVDYDRPLMYYDDLRLPKEQRIGRKTFGRIGRIKLDVGHLAANEVINRQYGRLAQMETFLMSNMSPQYGSFNRGVWLKLETAIREIEDEPGKDHVWAVIGPIFGDQPPTISRGRGKNLPIPEKYFCIVVDPFQYPFDTPSKVHIDCFILPQDAPRGSNPKDYPASLEEIEAATKLKFFDSWGRDYASSLNSTLEESNEDSRLMRNLNKIKSAERAGIEASVEAAQANSVDDLIEILTSEANELRNRERDENDLNHLRTLQHTISWLLRARNLEPVDVDEESQPSSTVITYKIVSDVENKLQNGARTACNFWNRFVEPKDSIVIRLGVFTQNSGTIARAYKPYTDREGTLFGRVEFNTKYMADFSSDEIAGTIIHEIGHSLGIGWEKWQDLYDRDTGKFKPKSVRKLNSLHRMEVERDGGSGTAFAHWDEEMFDKELMTGYQDSGEHVLPVTIDVMKLLGHKVIERLDQRTPLEELLTDAANMIFLRQDDARALNLDHFVETEILETIPHQ